MLELKDICIAYDEQVVAKNINLKVKKGEIVCVVGESGCGKTSILKSIIGILPKNAKIVSGDVLFKGKSLLNLSKKEQNKIRGKEISLLFQNAGLSLNPVRKIGKQFIQYIQTHTKLNKKEAYTLACETLSKTNLQNPQQIMNSYTFELSGGMNQRVGLAFAFCLNPSFLLLDEPTSALDVTTQAQVVEEILKMRDEYNSTILLITHNIPLAVYMADYIVVMKKGEILEENTALQIFKNPQHSYTKELLSSIPHLESNENE